MDSPQGQPPPARQGSVTPQLRQPQGVGCPTPELPSSLDVAGQGGVWPWPCWLGVEPVSSMCVLPGCLSRAALLPCPELPRCRGLLGEEAQAPSTVPHPPLPAHQQFNLCRTRGMVLVESELI